MPRNGRIGQSRQQLATAAMFFGTVLFRRSTAEVDLVTRYTLRRNAAAMMKI